MAQVVEYQIKGTSDVPQQTAKAKAAMSELDKQTQAVTKKFTEFGKDFILGFFAPMVLIHSAINFITAAIEQRRKDIADALAFADQAEAKLFASQQEIEAARQARERKQAEENKKKAEELKVQARIEFFKTTPEGYAQVQKQLEANAALRQGPYGSLAMGAGIAPQSVDQIAEALARNNEQLTPELQAAFDKFFGAAAEQRAAKKAEEDAAKAGAKAAVFAGDNSVFGVGNSPQMNILNQQVELQKQANEYLAVIAASAGGAGDFTKDTTGGMASQVNYKDYTKTV
ncbi:MAG: hypothetical protein RIR91_367 [Verrucomicrobiota bacterium]|jgi:DNA repair exonuclease SbcCD ATPase subunit